jgi:hypothetical protein
MRARISLNSPMRSFSFFFRPARQQEQHKQRQVADKQLHLASSRHHVIALSLLVPLLPTSTLLPGATTGVQSYCQIQ